jgi:hypothetical protein
LGSKVKLRFDFEKFVLVVSHYDDEELSFGI